MRRPHGQVTMIAMSRSFERSGTWATLLGCYTLGAIAPIGSATCLLAHREKGALACGAAIRSRGRSRRRARARTASVASGLLIVLAGILGAWPVVIMDEA